jgi:hypothetical protein
MAKILTAYGNWTATEIKLKASIPASADMSVVGNTVECSNVVLSYIKTVLGSLENEVSALCLSVLVNIWSGFGPTEWIVEAYYLVNRVKTPYKLGNFAGYSHEAAEARVATEHCTEKAFLTPVSSTFTVALAVNSGEINFPAIEGGQNIAHVVLKVYNSIGELKATKSAEVSTFMKSGDQIPFAITDAITSTATSDETWYCLVYFGTSVDDLVAYYPQPIATSPVVHHWTIDVAYLESPTFSINANMSSFPSFGTMQTVAISGSPSYVDIATGSIYVRTDLKLIPTFSDCGGLGNFPRFSGSPLVYNINIVLYKGETHTEETFTDVLSSDVTCVTYANTGDNSNPPFQRIWFDWTLPSGHSIFYGDHVYIYITRKNSLQYGYCSGGTPVYVP